MKPEQVWGQVRAWLDKAIGIMMVVVAVVVAVGLSVIAARALGYGKLAGLIGYGLSLEQTVWLAGGVYLLGHSRR